MESIPKISSPQIQTHSIHPLNRLTSLDNSIQFTLQDLDSRFKTSSLLVDLRKPKKTSGGKGNGVRTWFVFTRPNTLRYYFQFVKALLSSLKMMGINTLLVLDGKELRSRARGGDTVIVVGNVKQSGYKSIPPVVEAKGLRTILYETESIYGWELLTRYNAFRPMAIWTYSHYNKDWIENHSNIPCFYLPPGYSPTYNYRLHPSYNSSTITSEPITLLDVGRENRSLPLTLQNIDYKEVHAWDDLGFAVNITNHKILLNTHKKRRVGLEMFRLGPLISSGMNILSEHSYWKDEATMKGIVTFSKPAEMNFILSNWRKMSKIEMEKRSDDIIERFQHQLDFNDLLYFAIQNMKDL